MGASDPAPWRPQVYMTLIYNRSTYYSTFYYYSWLTTVTLCAIIQRPGKPENKRYVIRLQDGKLSVAQSNSFSLESFTC